MAGEEPFNYDVAISYAGPDRWAAEELVGCLTDKKLRVFYDRDKQAHLVGKNLIDFLTDLYQNQARLCVVLISAHYRESDYTNLERQAAQARAMHEPGYIFPIKLDSTDLPGMPNTVGYIDWHKFEPSQITDLICERLQSSDSPVTVSRRARCKYSKLILASNSAREIVDFKREIALFQNMLDGKAPPILFIQDGSGTGKTTLLYKYMEICEARGAIYGFVDLKGGYLNSPEKVLENIARQTEIISAGASAEDFLSSVNDVGSSHPNCKVVLLLDTFNDARGLESWIIDKLLIPIHRDWVDNLIVVIAGRQVPTLPPEEGDWEESVTHLWKLPKWEADQVREFGEAIGWLQLREDEDRVRHFLLSSGGDPHICSLIIRRYYKNLRRGGQL